MHAVRARGMPPSAPDPAKSAERLVKRAVRAGGPADVPSAEAVKAIKQFARQDDARTLLVAVELWAHLGAKSSQVRLLALNVCAELWPRSSAFRHALLARMMPEFVQLVIGDAGDHPLPPPAGWANALRSRACELVEQWHASHGRLDGYRGLGVVRHYLLAQQVTRPPAGGASGGDNPMASQRAKQEKNTVPLAM